MGSKRGVRGRAGERVEGNSAAKHNAVEPVIGNESSTGTGYDRPLRAAAQQRPMARTAE